MGKQMIFFLIVSVVLLLLVIAIKVAPKVLVTVTCLALFVWFAAEVASRSPAMQ